MKRVAVRQTEDYEAALREAAECLAGGGLVVFPTDTAYAVGADPRHVGAVQRLRELKPNADEATFALHVFDAEAAGPLVARPSRLSTRLMTRAWPGPLTLMVDAPADKPAPGLASLPAEAVALLTAGGSLGLRCPDHDAALGMLHYAAAPVMAVGAGRAGMPPPRHAEPVAEELAGRADLMLDAGEVRYTKPSTIVRVRGEQYEILRPGVYEDRVLRQLASTMVLFVCTGNSCRSPMAEGLFRRMLADRLGTTPELLSEHGLLVMSAGVHAGLGLPASEEAVVAAGEMGADLGRHRSRPLTPELLAAADRVYTMTRSHGEAARSIAPGCADKIRPLDPSGDVADPVGSDVSEYRRCAGQIRDLLQPLAEQMVP